MLGRVQPTKAIRHSQQQAADLPRAQIRAHPLERGRPRSDLLDLSASAREAWKQWEPFPPSLGRSPGLGVADGASVTRSRASAPPASPPVRPGWQKPGQAARDRAIIVMPGRKRRSGWTLGRQAPPSAAICSGGDGGPRPGRTRRIGVLTPRCARSPAAFIGRSGQQGRGMRGVGGNFGSRHGDC